MKSFVFPYVISSGKMDETEGSIVVALSDEKAKRLERTAKEGGRVRLDGDAGLEDVHDDVYAAFLRSEEKNLKANPSPVEAALSWEENYDPAKPVTLRQIREYLADLQIVFYYPVELQNLPPTVHRRAKQKEYPCVTISREEAAEYIKEAAHRDSVVYVDDGKTLYYVPKNYAGKLTVSSSVRAFERNVLTDHSKIAEITIEDGMEGIPEEAFLDCKGVTQINLPSSVRKISYNAFRGCERLTSVVLSDGLEELDSTAFRFCYALEELHFPASLKTLSMYITTYWNKLRDLYFAGMDTEIEYIKTVDWKRVTLYGFPGSRVEEFAKKHRIKFYPI